MEKNDFAVMIELNPEKKNLPSRHELIKRAPVTEQGQKIVAATVEEFAANGVQGTRVADICRRAGTTDPTFYRYFFGLRQAALFVISEYYWAPLNQRLNHYLQVTDDQERLFEAVVTALIRSTDDDPSRPWLAESKVFRIVVAESRNPLLLQDIALDDEYIGFLARLEKIIESGKREKIFTADLRPALLSSLLVTTLHGLLAQSDERFQPFVATEKEVRQVAANIVGLNI